MDVIIFCGQSNMQGQSERISESAVVPNAYEYKFLTDSVVPLKNPVGENIRYDMTEGYVFEKTTNHPDWIKSHIAGSACYGHTNLVPEFCRAYTAVSDSPALAVHIAKGSTCISYWLSGGGGYKILVRKAKAAIKKVNPKRIIFVWLQGESDAIEGNSKDYYKKNLLLLSGSLKKDIGIEKFAIIQVGRFTNDERDFEIICAQKEVCQENADFLMLTDITSELCNQSEYMNPDVRGHFSAKGLELIGKVAGDALADKTKNPWF